MSELNVTVYVEHGVPARIEAHFEKATKSSDVVRAVLRFTDARGRPQQLDLKGWKAIDAAPVRPGYVSRIWLAPPPRFATYIDASSHPRLELSVKGRASPLRGPTEVQDDRPHRNGAHGDAREAIEAAKLFTAYPIVTAPGPDGMSGGGGGAAGGDARATVQKEWRAVLGRVPSDGDVPAMLAALDRRFVASEEDGVEGWVWTSSSPAGQNDIGAGVTGAQASLAALAQRVTEEIEPYVKEARPLKTTCDNPEAVEIARRSFTASWRSFVNSLGAEGGVPIARSSVLLRQACDQLATFGEELGLIARQDVEALNGELAKGEYDAISETKLLQEFVLTRDDVDRLTGFTIVRDRVGAVAHLFREMTPAPTHDYGTALTLLQRNLDVLPDQVTDVRWALESVDCGPEQQEAAPLKPGDSDSITIAGALQWAEELAEEGRVLLQEAGVDGGELLATRAAALHTTLKLFLDSDEGPGSKDGVLARRIGMSRIRVPVELLIDTVEDVRRRADEIKP